ncbi:MAG: hypothetical protein EOP38_22350 [Rubrivivax sp.]|nr:MAG: hypothetical protein EOP38_22350 [Rubrivivax sp.]
MWLLDRFLTPGVLRLGRRSAHLHGAWSALDNCNLAAPNALADKLAGLVTQVPTANPWSAVLDSAWLPVTTLDTQQAWTSSEVKALALHRWASLYGATVGTWKAQTLYLPGDARATVFGLPELIKAQLDEAGRVQQRRLASIQPACLWAWQQAAPLRKKHPRGLMVWCEEDRCIVGRYDSRQFSVLDPSAQLPESWNELDQLVRPHIGDVTPPILLMSWQPLPWAASMPGGHWGSHQGGPLACVWLDHGATTRSIVKGLAA